MTASPDSVDAGLEDLVSALVTASRTLVAISADSLAEVEDMLTLSEFRALVVLRSHGGCTVSGLARRLPVRLEAAERIASRLTQGGFADTDDDGLLQLTHNGDGLVARVTELRRAALRRIVAEMEEDDRQTLVDSLIAFASAAGEPLAVGLDPAR